MVKSLVRFGCGVLMASLPLTGFADGVGGWGGGGGGTPPPSCPTVSFSFQTQGLAISLASTSQAGSTPIIAYEWTFGDGSGTFTGTTQRHTFAAAGTYTIHHTVRDANGFVETVAQMIVVSATTNIAGATPAGYHDPNHSHVEGAGVTTSGSQLVVDTGSGEQPNILYANGTNATQVILQNACPNTVYNITYSFGTGPGQVTTDGTGRVSFVHATGLLPVGTATTTVGTIQSNLPAGGDVSTASAYHYRRYTFGDLSQTIPSYTNATFQDPDQITSAQIQTLLETLPGGRSYLADFKFVGRPVDFDDNAGAGGDARLVEAYWDKNQNNVFDAGDVIYEPEPPFGDTPDRMLPSGPTVVTFTGATIFRVVGLDFTLNPKILVTTLEKEQSLVRRTTIESSPGVLDPALKEKMHCAMGCGAGTSGGTMPCTPFNPNFDRRGFYRQLRCAASTFVTRFTETNIQGDSALGVLTFPHFWRTTYPEKIGHILDNGSSILVGFAVSDRSTYAQYRYTPGIHQVVGGGGVWSFVAIWQVFGF